MSLTDDFLNKKLRAGSFYFVEMEKGHPEPMVVDIDGDFNDYEGNYYKPEFSKGKLEVLASCDYNHFVELTEKVRGLEKDVENLTNNYKLLESKQAVDIAHGQALVDEFGDYEAVYQEITQLRNENRQLRQLLKEVKEKIHDEFINQDIVSIDNFHELLTKINEVLG